MKYTEYEDANAFLARTQEILEDSEAVNGLMLGLALRLRNTPLMYGSQPLFATIGEGHEIALIVLMTPPHKLQILSPHGAREEAFEILTTELRERGWPVPAVIAEREIAESFADKWTRIAGQKSRLGTQQRIYELREVKHPDYPPGAFRQAASDDLGLAKQWAKSFQDACFGSAQPEAVPELAKRVEAKVKSGGLFFWVVSEPVSMAARTRPTPNGEAIGFVYTPPQHRRNGYATAVVARLSQLILDDGKRCCTLYTDLSNPTSNSIYRKIGYSPVADVVDIHFEE